MFAEDVQRLCGPKGKHNEARAGYRHGSQAGCVALGGRRLVVERPRVRSAGAHGELALPSYELFSSVEVLHRLAMERMLAGLSTRRYGVGQEPVGEEVSRAAKGTSRWRSRGASWPPPRAPWRSCSHGRLLISTSWRS